MSSGQSGLLKKFYCIIGIVLLLCSGYIVERLVMHIWHKASSQGSVDDKMSREDTLFKKMTEGLGEDRKAASYKNIDKIDRLYDFHKSEQKIVLDKVNLCISCHGDLPHNNKKETRAFLNMHAFFMACETCHIRLEEEVQGTFIWYDKTTGHEKKNINLNYFLGNTPYKLMPVKNGGARVYDTEKMINYVKQFKSKVPSLGPNQRTIALKVVHRPVTDVDASIECKECHTFNLHAAYLTFEHLGYPKRRADQLVRNEVVGMLQNYNTFYLPGVLKPDSEGQK